MWLKYRTFTDSVSDFSRANRYGYFEQLESAHPRTKELLKAGTKPQTAAPWPLTVQVQVTIHNHEDLQHFMDCVLQAYDTTRGEHGENEKTSPSEFRLKF